MKLTVFGIPNCDTVKKAMNWLKEKDIDLTFHNYKTQGVTRALLLEWSKQVGWELLLNKKGTTWKKLSAEEQASATNTKSVVDLLEVHTSMIKRPVITMEDGQVLVVGFDKAAQEILAEIVKKR